MNKFTNQKIKKRSFYSAIPIPNFLVMPSIGMDISDHAIRYIEFIRKGKGMDVGRYGTKLITDKAIVHGGVRNGQKLAELLIAVKKEIPDITKIHASLPSEKAYLFAKEIQGTGKKYKELRTILEFKLEESVPIPPQDVLFDFEQISDNQKSETTLVSVTAIPYQLVNDYYKVFQQANFNPMSFETEGRSIVRAVMSPDDMETTIVIDFGAIKTGLFIVSKGAIQFASTLDLGSDMLTNAIQNSLGVDRNKAESIKRKKGFVRSAENENVMSAMINVLSNLKDEVERHLIYWKTHKDTVSGSGASIKKILLCGGGANLKGLASYLTMSLKLKVETANVWQNVFDTSSHIPPIFFEESLSYVTAIGLALRSKN